MSVSRDIWQSYLHPRRVTRRHLSRGVNESRVFVFLVVACILIYVAQWPRLSREAHFDATIPLEGRMVAAMWAWIFVAPLIFYAIAALSYLFARVLGGKGSGLGARLALFWTLLVTVPLWLLNGVIAGFMGEGLQVNITGGLLVVAFFWIWISSLIETQFPDRDDENV